MKLKLNLIGFASFLLACLLCQFSATLYLGYGFSLVGLALTFGYYPTHTFLDYITQENDSYIISLRIRHYYCFIPFSIVLNYLKLDLMFVYKVERFHIRTPTLTLEGIDIPSCKITGAEYKQLLQHQKRQYADKLVPQDLVAELCSPNEIRLKRAKTKYTIPLILCLLMLTALTDPTLENLALMFSYGGLLAWLTIIRRKEYREAKFKASVYSSYFPINSKQKA